MFDMLRIYLQTVMETCICQFLHLPRVEFRCKLQEKLHRVTGPLEESTCQYFLSGKSKM